MPDLQRLRSREGKEVMEYTNSHITYLINEYIHNKRDREIMIMHYVDGLSAETIATVIPLSPRRISQILSDRLLEISPYL